MNIIEIGKRVRRARRKAGMSQAELARAVGYSAANPISKLESGKFATVDIRLLYRIADVTGVTVGVLVGNTPVELPSEPDVAGPELYPPEPDWSVVRRTLDRMACLLEELVERIRKLDERTSLVGPALRGLEPGDGSDGRPAGEVAAVAAARPGVENRG